MKTPITLFATVLFASLIPADTHGEEDDPRVIDLTREEAATLISENEDLVILDVRTAEEFSQGHLPGAINVDFLTETFPKEVGKLDPEKTYLLHCQSGGRSSQAIPVLESLGFTHLYHLPDGYYGWSKSDKGSTD